VGKTEGVWVRLRRGHYEKLKKVAGTLGVSVHGLVAILVEALSLEETEDEFIVVLGSAPGARKYRRVRGFISATELRSLRERVNDLIAALNSCEKKLSNCKVRQAELQSSYTRMAWELEDCQDRLKELETLREAEKEGHLVKLYASAEQKFKIGKFREENGKAATFTITLEPAESKPVFLNLDDTVVKIDGRFWRLRVSPDGRLEAVEAEEMSREGG